MPFTSLVKHALVAVAIAGGVATASSHSEAPDTSSNPSSDLTDVYAFRSYEEGKEDKVVFLLNLQPLQQPYAGPNYYSLSDTHYIDLNIDNDGDAVPDLTLRIQPGHELGGDEGPDVLVNDVDANCSDYSLQLMNVTRRVGQTINVGGVDVKVPLKVLGPITEAQDANLNYHEFVQITSIDGDGVSSNGTDAETGETRFPIPFDNVGTKTFPDYETYANQFIHDIDFGIDGCAAGRMFVGQRQESFGIQLGRIFDLVNMVPVVDVGVSDCPENNALSAVNVATVALEIDASCLLSDPDQPIIGIWSVVRKLHHERAADGVSEVHVPGRQISRLGNPLVNELVIGLGDKDKFSYSPPTEDAQFGVYVTNPTMPEIIDSLFLETVNGALMSDLDRIAPSNFPRQDLVTTFLTGFPGLNQIPGSVAAEYLRLNTAVPATPRDEQSNFGVVGEDLAGFPNGRRPGDDVVDIGLRVLMGRLCHDVPLGLELGLDTDDINLGLCTPEDAPVGLLPFGDGAPQNAGQFLDVFPFLNTPLPGSVAAENPLVCEADIPPETTCSVAIADCSAGEGICTQATTATAGRSVKLQFAPVESCDE